MFCSWFYVYVVVVVCVCVLFLFSCLVIIVLFELFCVLFAGVFFCLIQLSNVCLFRYQNSLSTQNIQFIKFYFPQEITLTVFPLSFGLLIVAIWRFLFNRSRSLFLSHCLFPVSIDVRLYCYAFCSVRYFFFFVFCLCIWLLLFFQQFILFFSLTEQHNRTARYINYGWSCLTTQLNAPFPPISYSSFCILFFFR